MTGPVRTDVELGDAWAYGAGVLHGGWLLETVVEQALRHTAHPHPLAVSAQYAAASRIGAATVEVERVREGRSVGSLRARLRQEDTPRIDVLLTAGTLPSADLAPLHVGLAPPELPPVEDCVPSRMPPGAPRNGILEQLDFRLDPATAGFAEGEPGGGTEIRGWVRSRDGREPDPLMLLTLGDALPPVTVEMGIAGWVPTIELTVHLRALPAPGWLRCVQRAGMLSGGWLDEVCEVWDSTGRLVCQARQLAGYRQPA